MRVASWNIRGNNGINAKRQRAILAAIEASSPDIIVLQEVAWKGDIHEDLMAGLMRLGWSAVAYGGVIGSSTVRHGNLVASRFPLTLDESDWAPGLPWKQSLIRVIASCDETEVVIIGAHIPNGSGNGWVKIETFEALADALDPNVHTGPTVVMGDFNEPRLIMEDGTVIPFAMKATKDGHWSSNGNMRGKCGRRFPRQRWIDGVRSILGREPAVDLMHAVRATDGPAAWHTTHEVLGKSRFFDHVLVSSHWNVVETGFDDDVRLQGTSDHSLVWADLKIKANLS